MSRLLGAGKTRMVLLETLLCIALVGLGMIFVNLHSPPSITRSIVIYIAGPLCALWMALRLRLSTGKWWQQAGVELLAALVLSLVLSGLALALRLLPHGGLAPTEHWKISPLEAAALALAINALSFLICRVLLHFWLSWSQLRRRQLLWNYTHVQLSIITALAGLLIIIMVIPLVLILQSLPLIVLFVFALLLLVGGILAFIIPLSLLFSYLMVRRTLPRLKELAGATGAFRSGQYNTRIPVSGEDEVAQLQTDFNAMADHLESVMGNLEKALGELQNERDTVTRLLQERRELMANVSHELRTPMSTLRSYLEITLNHWEGTTPADLRHHLGVMEDEVIRLQALVDDLFTLSRAEVGRLTIRCEAVDIRKLIQPIIEARALLARQASKVELIADLPLEIAPAYADPQRLAQVLQNLLHNAIRHTPPGGIVAVSATEEAESISLQVKDTGEGIAAEELSSIWQRFYQTESLHNRVDGGSGLGLALVKEWIETMAGTISVESMPNEGTCFTIRLQRADSK